MKENRDERLQQIAEKALEDSVVRLVWQVSDENADEFVAMRGSGFFVTANLIVTNLHGVAGAPAIVAERVSSETEFPVEGVVASDIANDLVILKVTSQGVPLSLGDSDTVQIDDTVCAVGHPHGEKGVATQVTIHGIRKSDKYFEIKEAFDPGQSGGPLLNGIGEVIGVAAAGSMAISFGPGGAQASLSYAIPARVLAAILADVGETEPLEEWQKQPRIRGYTEGLKGQMHMMQQKYEAAIACFDAALELNPNLVEIYTNRGTLKMLSRKAAEAIADWDAAIKLKPDFFPLYVNRASANLLVKQYKAAIADCNAALELNPDFFQVYSTRATAKLILKNYQGAIEDYDKFIELKQEDDKTHINRGRMTHLIINAYHNRGRAKRFIGDYEGAIADCNQAIQRNDKEGGAYYIRGEAKRLLGQSKTPSERITLYEEAIDDYTEAIKINPKFRLAYRDRGRAKEALGQHEEAKTDFAKAKELAS